MASLERQLKRRKEKLAKQKRERKSRAQERKPVKFANKPPEPQLKLPERLICAAIKRGTLVHGGFNSHSQIRGALGDKNPYVSTPGDVEGFATSHGRFLDRRAAQDVAFAAGQITRRMERDMLSSDIDW